MAKLTKPFNEVGPGKPGKINQEKQNETKKRTVQQYRPFENEHLDSLWRSTVYKYHKDGSKNALEEAERDVRQYAMDVYQSDKLGAKDPLGAAQRRLDSTSEQNLFNYKTKGATDYASLKAIWDAEGFKTKSQVEQENRQRAIDAAMAQYSHADIARLSAAGEQDNVLNDWLDENPAMQFAMENPGQVSVYTDFWKNLPAYASAVYNGENNGFENLPKEMQNPWIDFAGTDDAFDILGGMTRFDKISEDQLAQLAEYGQEMAAQYEAAGEIYQPYTTSKFQDHLWEKMIQTPEGAQAWLDEAMGTEEEQAAWDNNWQVSRDAKYGAMEEEVQKQLSQFQRPKGGAQEFALPEKFRNDPEYSFVNGVDTGANLLYMTLKGMAFYYTDVERGVYNVLYGEGKEEEKKAANDYLQWKKYKKGELLQTFQVEAAKSYAHKDPVAGSVMHLLSNPFRSLGALDIALQAARNAINPEQRRPIYTHGTGNIYGAVADASMQQVMDDINWNVNIFGHEVDLADKIYGAFMNTADSLTTSLLAKAFGGGSPKLAEGLSKIFIGSQAAQSAMMDAQERKGNDGQVILSGALAGALESITEQWSLGRFWDSAAKTKSGDWKALLLDTFAQMGINGSEELSAEAGNWLADVFVMGEKSKAKQAYDYYIDMGLDDKQAKLRLAADLGQELAQAFEGGALQGLLMSGVSNTASGTRQHSENKRVGKAIIAGETEAQILDKAKAFGPDSLSAKSAQKYEKKKTPAGLGKVFRDTLNTMDQRGRRELFELTFGQVKMALNADGEIANVDAVATAIVDLYAGNRLDADEMQALAESKKGMDVAQELLGMDMLTMTALEDAGKAEKKGAAHVGELTKAVQAPEGMTQQEAQEAETKGAAPVGELPKAIQAPEGMAQQEAQEAPEMPEQQSVEVTGADGSTTEIAGIREDDDGQAVIETADGNEIDLEDAGLTESQQQIANEARGTEYAAQILGAYTEAESMTTNARDFSRGFNRVAAAAANGKTLEEATKGIYAGKISKAAQQAAYAAGQNSRAQMTAQQSSATYKAAQRDGFRMLTADIGSKAGLYYANVTGKVTDAAKTMMRVIGRFAEEAGIQIQVFDTQGKANGAYTQGTNVIRLALDADQGALTKVASHEVYHYIKDWNSDGADRLAKKVFEYLEKADGYNLDQRVQEKIQEYARANVTLSEDAAKEEIVADALLDFIGTEENFRAILSEDSKLAEKIRAWVQQIMARIRSILETMAASNPEVRVLKDNAQYMAEIAEMMDGILEETREIMESTKKGESARIKNDPAVTEYREDMRTAKDESERQSALNGLMAEAFMRTQKEWLQKHPDADMDSAIAEFREALSAYGRGEKFVQKALEDAGFISPTTGSNEMALLSFAGQQAAMMEERGTKYSIQTLPDGTQYVLVDTDQHIFDGADESEYKNIAKEYIKKHFSGNLYGKNGDIKVTTRSAKEYTYPANRRIKPEIKLAKMKAATEIDNLIEVSEFLGHEDDDGRHPLAANGWDNYNVIYKVDGKYFEGITRIMLTEDQPLFYDIAKIKEIGIARRSRTISHDATGREHGNASGDSVADGGEKVNEKFSLKAPVEKKKTLMAIHNLTEAKLTKALELGGFPMPSIAIAKAEIGHQNFGPISLVFGRDTIDPTKNKKNVGYTADAWTPTFPQIEYQTDSKKEAALQKWARALDIPEYYRSELNRALYSLEDQANKRDGLEGLADYLAENKGMQAAYLTEQGTPVEIVKTEKQKNAGFPESMKDRLQQAIDLFNGDMDYAMHTSMNQIWDEYGDRLAAIFPSLQGHKERMPRILTYAKALSEYQSPEYEMVDDYGATEAKMRESLDETAFREWIYDQIDGIIIGSGIYNNKEIYTPSGNRRSFEQLHYPVTIENIVKAMAGQKKGNTKNISGYHGVKSLRASTAETFKSIDEMHAWEDRLQARTEEEANALTDALQGRLDGLIDRILAVKGWHNSYENIAIEMDTVGEILLELSDGKYTKDSIKNGFNQYKYAVDDALAGEIEALLDEIKHMPVNIFEAKPERAVGFDEVKAAIIPRDTDPDVKNGLAKQGIQLLEYEDGNEAERLRLLNGLDEQKFSLKESPTAPVEEGLKEDAELYAQIKASNEGKAALQILQKLYGMATRGDSYLMAGEKEALIEKGAWQKRMPEIMEKIKAETGSEINERKLRSDLAAIFNAMDRGEDVSDMLMAAKDLGRDILAEAPGMMNPIDPSVKEAMRIIKERKFYLTDEMKSEIRNVLIGNVVETTRKLRKPKENQEADLTEHQRACEKKFRQDQAALENHGKRIDRLEEGQKVICAALHELLEHELHNGNAAAMKAASDNLFDYLNGK